MYTKLVGKEMFVRVKVLSFHAKFVPKHIWEVGMWIGHACDMQYFIE